MTFQSKSGCNWFQAKHICNKKGGYLAEITSQEEQVYSKFSFKEFKTSSLKV